MNSAQVQALQLLARELTEQRAALAPIERSWAAKPFPAQEAAVRDSRRVVAMFAGVRGGKTQGAAWAALSRIWAERCAFRSACQWGEAEPWRPIGSEPFSDRDEPRRRYWVTAGTHSLAREAWLKLVLALSEVQHAIVKQVAGEVWLDDGTLIEVRTGKDERQLQGARLDGVWGDEVCSFPEASWDQLQNRIADRQGWAILSGSPRPGTWPKRRIWDAGESDDLGIHHWHTADNPHIPRAEVERARRELPELWFRRDWLASWDTFQGLVYSTFDAAANVLEFDRSWLSSSGARVTLAADFGIRKPAAQLWLEHPGIGSDGGPGDIAFDEVVSADVSVVELAHLVADRCDAWGVRLAMAYADPAGKARTEADKRTSVSMLAQVLRERRVLLGAVVCPESPEQRSVENGLRAMQTRIRSMDGTRRLFVSSELMARRYPVGLLGIGGALQAYKWRDRPGAEVPEKDGVSDHACDAARYREVCIRPPGRMVAGRLAPRLMAVGGHGKAVGAF